MRGNQDPQVAGFFYCPKNKEINMKLKLLGLEAVAEILDVPISWLYRNCFRMTGVEIIKIGKYSKIREDQLIAWVESGAGLDG